MLRKPVLAKFLIVFCFLMLVLTAHANGLETTDFDKDSDGDGIADVGWVRLGADIVGDKAKDFTGGGRPSLSFNGRVAAIYSTLFDSDRGRVRVYSWDGSSWVTRESMAKARLSTAI